MSINSLPGYRDIYWRFLYLFHWRGTDWSFSSLYNTGLWPTVLATCRVASIYLCKLVFVIVRVVGKTRKLIHPSGTFYCWLSCSVETTFMILHRLRIHVITCGICGTHIDIRTALFPGSSFRFSFLIIPSTLANNKSISKTRCVGKLFTS